MDIWSIGFNNVPLATCTVTMNTRREAKDLKDMYEYSVDSRAAEATWPFQRRLSSAFEPLTTTVYKLKTLWFVVLILGAKDVRP